MTPNDFPSELRKEEARRQEVGLAPARRGALRARIAASTSGGQVRARSRARIGWLLAPVAIASVVLAWALLRPARELGPFRLASASGDLQVGIDEGAVVRVERGDCTLLDEASGATLSTMGPVALHKDAGGIRVLLGRVRFSVQHRAQGRPPQVVLVSHGQIEVMGTKFLVTQGPAGGSVFLEEGLVRFRAPEGLETLVHPGETLSWPPPAPQPAAPVERPAPPVAPPLAMHPPHPAPTRREPPASESDEEFLRRVDELRNRNDFEGAVHELKRGLSGAHSPATRERLSFELGALLTHQIHDSLRACQQWAWHSARFPGGRFAPEVARMRKELACPAP